MHSKFNRTCAFVYALAVKRITERKDALQIPYIAIDEENPKLLSHIFNNRRTANNPYLITPAAGKKLTEALGFGNTRELYWGSDQEIEGYAEELFSHIVLDVFNENHEELRNTLHEVLIDFIPYAKWSPYLSASEEADTSAASETWYFADFNLNKPDIVNNVKIARAAAISRFYRQQHKLGGTFLSRFIEFTEEVYELDYRARKLKSSPGNIGNNRGFKKLPDRIEQFAREQVQQIFSKKLPLKNSLGKRVYMLMAEDLVTISNASIYWSTLDGLEELLPGGDEDDGEARYHLLNRLLRANNEYIERLEKIQQDADGVHLEGIVDPYKYPDEEAY